MTIQEITIKLLTVLIPILFIIVGAVLWIDKEFDKINEKIVKLEKDLIIVKTSINYLNKFIDDKTNNDT